MYCEKCGKKIVDDSIYCSYCGVSVSAQEHAREDDCIRPYMAKKKCVECGKELPGSTISDACALCIIKRRNRELDNQVKNPAPSARYDLPNAVDPFKQKPSSHNGFDDLEYEGDSSAKNWLPWVVIVAFVIIVCVISVLIFSFSSSDTHEEVISVSVPAESVPAPSDAVLDFAEMNEMTLDTLFFEYVSPVTQQMIIEAFPEADVMEDFVFSCDIEDMTNENAYLYTNGDISYTLGEEYIEYQFYACLMTTENAYMPLLLELEQDGTTTLIYDYRNEVDNLGFITEEGSLTFGLDPGTPLFDETPIFMEDMA